MGHEPPSATARPFTPKTLAEHWGCSEEHIRDLLKAGEIAGFRVGTLWRIPAREVARIETLKVPAKEAAEAAAKPSVPRIVMMPGRLMVTR